MKWAKHHILSLCIAAAMLLAAMLPGGATLAAYAASDPMANRFDISEGSISILPGGTPGTVKVLYGTNNNKDSIPSSSEITITGTSNGSHCIYILASCNLVLEDLDLTYTHSGAYAIGLADPVATVSIRLSGDNRVISTLPQVHGIVLNGATMIIRGSGSLSVSGMSGIDISINSHLTIGEQAKVTAEGTNGPGISGAGSSRLTVSGSAEVSAKGNNGAAGIGGKQNTPGGIVVIEENARVTAKGDSNDFGSGSGSSNGGSVTIKDNARLWGGGNAVFRDNAGTQLYLQKIMVADTFNNPLEGVLVEETSLTRSTKTDSRGEAYLYFPSPAVLLIRFSKTGFATTPLITFSKLPYEETKNYQLSRLYPLTATVSPAGSGTLSIYSEEYLPGDPVSVSASAAQGWYFHHWEATNYTIPTGAETISSISFFMPANAVGLTAVFQPYGTGVTLGKSAITLPVGGTEPLLATVHPPGANQTVAWSSDNPAVASVDATGLVTAHSQGAAVITATTAEGGYTATCAVTVSNGVANSGKLPGVSTGNISVAEGRQATFDISLGSGSSGADSATIISGDETLATAAPARLEQSGTVTVQGNHRGSTTLSIGYSGGGRHGETDTVQVAVTGFDTAPSSSRSSNTSPTREAPLAPQPRAVTLAEAMAAYRAALPDAQNGVATARLAGWFSDIGLSVQQALAKQAALDGVSVRLQINQVQNLTTMAQLTLNPAEATGNVALTAFANSPDAVNRETLFRRWFQNRLIVVSTGQSGAYGQPVRLAVKTRLDGLDTANLVFYSYDRAANTYRRISEPAYRVGNNGNLYFTTERAGDIVISEGALVKKQAEALTGG